jgi:hypothetical protein
MLQKVFIKVSILVFALCLVWGATSFFASNDFKKSVADLFATDVKTYSWCPDHSIDFEWLDQAVSEKWKKASSGDIQSRFCKLTLETIQGVDLAKLSFKPLLKVQSAEAKTALLEWNPQSSVFQVNGLPFYSTSLSREILDR